MPVTENEVMKFIHLSIWKKQELKDANPDKYQELYLESKKKFKPDSDQEALKEINDNRQ